MKFPRPFGVIEREVRLTREFMEHSEQRYREHAEESERRYQEQLQLTREFIRRNEIVFNESREVLAELVQEVSAQREAIFALIDELRGGGLGPATS